MYTRKVTRKNQETGLVETVVVQMTAEETAARQAEEDQAAIDEAAAVEASKVLTPARFAYLLAITELEQVWADVEAYCKTNDPATYALLKAHGAAGEFRLTKTLATLATMKPLTDAVAPNVDLSEATIRAAWTQAEAAVI